MYYLGIEAFLVIIRTQNLSHAAEQLNLAQSTVSKRLQQLEQELGVVLIERGKGNKLFRLTEEGESFLELAQRWHHLCSETQSFSSQPPQLNLSIGTLLSMSYSFFPALFQALSQHQPSLTLKIFTRGTVELYDMMDRKEVDVAFTILHRQHPNIIVEKFAEAPFVGICKITSPYNKDHAIHPNELDSSHELFLKFGLIYQSWHNQWWKEFCPGRITLDTPQIIPSFLNSDQQWALIPLPIAKCLQYQFNYHIFELSDPPPHWISYKVTHKYPKASTAAALKIFDHYLEQLQQGLLPSFLHTKH